MSRKLAREDAFKLIFEMNVTGANPSDIIDYLISTVEKHNDMWAQKEPDDKCFEYIKKVVNGVSENREEINASISPKLKKWTVERLSKVDLSLLQLAVCEIMYDDTIPDKVSANEATELAKKYGTDDSGAFINGVIGSILNDREVKI